MAAKVVLCRLILLTGLNFVLAAIFSCQQTGEKIVFLKTKKSVCVNFRTVH